MIGKSVTLCYKFGDEPSFKMYNAFTMSVYDVQGVVSALHGSDTVAIAGQRKVFNFTGTGLSTNDTVRWLISGTDCNSNIAAAITGINGTHALSDVGGTISGEFAFHKQA